MNQLIRNIEFRKILFFVQWMVYCSTKIALFFFFFLGHCKTYHCFWTECQNSIFSCIYYSFFNFPILIVNAPFAVSGDYEFHFKHGFNVSIHKKRRSKNFDFSFLLIAKIWLSSRKNRLIMVRFTTQFFVNIYNDKQYSCFP